MIAFIVTAVFAFIVYLIFTAGTGTIGLWSADELTAGFLLSILVAGISRTFFCKKKNFRMLNPIRLLTLGLYLIGPFFIEMARANLDVAYRVITGRIRPGIVRINPGLKTDLGIVMLANSITLTPGTLTMAVDEEKGDIYVHMINVGEGVEKAEVANPEDIFTFFKLHEWIRRIAE